MGNKADTSSCFSAGSGLMMSAMLSARALSESFFSRKSSATEHSKTFAISSIRLNRGATYPSSMLDRASGAISKRLASSICSYPKFSVSQRWNSKYFSESLYFTFCHIVLLFGMKKGTVGILGLKCIFITIIIT